MGVVKSNFINIQILLILFSVNNQFVKSQEWEDPYFIDAQSDGIELVLGDNVIINVNEQLPQSVLVVVNYSGDTQPEIDDSEDGDKFLNDFGAEVAKGNDGKWTVTIDKSVDFEKIPANSYKPKLIINGESKYFFIVVKNVDDESPTLDADKPKCTVREGYKGSTECKYTVKDRDGCVTHSSISFTDEEQGNIFSLVWDDPEDLDYPACLDENKNSLKTEAKLHLEVNTELDYETIRSYFLEVVVQDGNDHTYISEIVINVEDIPDVAPIWTGSISTYTVEELKEETFQITARDGDTSINAPICYNLTVESAVSEDEKKYFEINENSGMVSIHKIDRDFYQHDTYSLKIFAVECDDENSNTDTTVSILVKDTNNHSPIICIRNVTDEEHDDCLEQVEIFLEEGKSSTLSSFISINVKDPDEGTSGTFTVSLEDDPSSIFNWHEAFQIIPKQGYQNGNFTISVADASKLDYEDENWRDIKLNVVAAEEADKTHNAKIPLSISLINLNDESPEFPDSGNLAVTRKENLPIDAEVYTVKATDKDGEEDKIKYGLVQTKPFKIDPDTGVITTNSDNALDYELQPQMVIQVSAEDSMDNVHHKVFATLTITVEDEDDVPPQISLSASSIDVFESEIEGFVLPVNIIATDVDTYSSLDLRIDWNASTGRRESEDVDLALFNECYELQKEPNGDDHELVGKLTVAKKLSWNVVDTIKLVLIVEDLKTDTGEKTKQATLTINIKDTNDHNPVFDSCEEKVLNIAENTDKDVRIPNSQIKAHDNDSSENGNNVIVYYIKPDHDSYEDFISFDPSSNYLFTGSAQIDFEKYQILEYTVTAHNEGGPNNGGNTTCRISINVTDVNDNTPTKDKIDPETVDIAEDSTTGRISTLSYHDDDLSAPFKKIKFEINDRSLLKYFKINDDGEGNAELVVDLSGGGNFDYDEGEKYYDVAIKIFDNPDNEDGGDQQFVQPLPIIRVNLMDVNDNSPVFNAVDGGSNTNNIKECSFKSTEDKKQSDHLSDDSLIQATDKDSGDLGAIVYNIESVTCIEGTNYKCLVPEEAKELFDVKSIGNGQQAYISAKKDLLNFFGEYIIELKARDKGDPPNFSDSRFYKGCILDVNDHQPTITYPNIPSLIIREGVGGGIIQNDGSPIPLFAAEDEDYEENAVVTFYLKMANPDEEMPFQLSHVNGEENSAKFELKNGLTFDDLKQDLYSLTVKACNGEETKDCPSRPLNIYKIKSDAAEPYWNNNEVQAAFTEGPIDDPKNVYTVPKAVDDNDFDIPGEDPYTEPIYYYIIGGTGNYTSFFEIDSTSGEISLIDNLDCEYRTNWTLQIQASNSNSDDAEQIPSPGLKSLLTVKITVTDINDKAPTFINKIYTSSVSDDIDVFLTVAASDPDSGDSVTYKIVPGSVENHVDGGGQIDLINVFKVDSKTGALTFDSKIDATFKGYLTVNISATDLLGHQDTCFVKVYIISASSKVPFNFRNSREQVMDNQNGAAEVFSVYFKHECIVGKILASENASDGLETVMWVHFRDDSGDPVPSSDIEILKDDSQLMKNLTNELMTRFSLFLGDFGNEQVTGTPEENYLVRTVLIGVCAVLGVLLVAMLGLYIVKTRNLRKLVGNLTKASVPHEDKGNFALPNTNQYSNEGSNPVFNATINTQQLDNASITSDDSSLIGIEDNPEFQAFYNNVILKSEGKADDDVLKENPELNAFRNSDNSAFNF